MKKVYCKICGNELNKWVYYDKTELCKSCSHKGKKIGLKNHNKEICLCGVCKSIRGETKGIKKSEETKILMSKNHRGHPLSLELRNKLSLIRIENGHSKGSNNCNWKGGMSKEPYSLDWTSELREEIRKRDNYECQNCGMTEEEHIIVVGRILHVHHIDYNKKNCKKDNLITLCMSCNIRTNFNRDYWQSFYTNKIIILTENGGITKNGYTI